MHGHPYSLIHHAPKRCFSSMNSLSGNFLFCREEISKKKKKKNPFAIVDRTPFFVLTNNTETTKGGGLSKIESYTEASGHIRVKTPLASPKSMTTTHPYLP